MNLNIYDFLIDIARKVSLDIQYPIGRCVLFDTEDFDPNEMWGGVWELTAINRMPIGAGDKYALGDTGGEETHTLNETELPNLYGRAGFYGSTPNLRGGIVADAVGKFSTETVLKNYVARPTEQAISGSNSYSSIVLDIGGDQPHNNMPPYQAFYIWKRIA